MKPKRVKPRRGMLPLPWRHLALVLLISGISGIAQVYIAWHDAGAATACADDCDRQHPGAPCPPLCNTCNASTVRTCTVPGTHLRLAASAPFPTREPAFWRLRGPPKRMSTSDVFHPPRPAASVIAS